MVWLGMMRNMRTIVLLALVASCGKKSDDAKPAPAVANKPAEPAPTDEQAAPQKPGSTVSGVDLSQLGPMMEEQRKHRGAGPKTDDVFATAEKAGFKIDQRKQLLANKSGASFCEMAEVSPAISLSVCEFGSDKDAAAAKARIDKEWSQLNSTVDRIAHKATLITVIHGGNKSPDVEKLETSINQI
jgi:hypothetical protein